MRAGVRVRVQIAHREADRIMWSEKACRGKVTTREARLVFLIGI